MCCISQERPTLRQTPSRIDWDWELTSEVVRVILNMAMEGCNLLAKICTHSTTMVSSFLVGGGTAEAQMQDQDLSWLYKTKQLETAKLGDFESREIKDLLCHQCKLTLQEGVLYLKTAPN